MALQNRIQSSRALRVSLGGVHVTEILAKACSRMYSGMRSYFARRMHQGGSSDEKGVTLEFRRSVESDATGSDNLFRTMQDMQLPRRFDALSQPTSTGSSGILLNTRWLEIGRRPRRLDEDCCLRGFLDKASCVTPPKTNGINYHRASLVQAGRISNIVPRFASESCGVGNGSACYPNNVNENRAPRFILEQHP